MIFVEGETKDTLPGYRLEGQMDLVLLDGPHAYPLPQIEFAYLFPHIKLGGWLVVVFRTAIARLRVERIARKMMLPSHAHPR